MNKKIKTEIAVGVIVILALLIGGAFWISNRDVACTADVHVCADGTEVGRSGPNCMFENCPAFSTTPDNKNANIITKNPFADLPDCPNDLFKCFGEINVARSGPDCEFKCPDKDGPIYKCYKAHYEGDRLSGTNCFEYYTLLPDENEECTDFNHPSKLSDGWKEVPESEVSFYKYRNKEMGIEFEMPYIENWGNDTCLVKNAYVEFYNEESGALPYVLFGFPMVDGGEYRLEFSEKLSSGERLDQLNKENEGDSYDMNPELIEINGLEVLRWKDSGKGVMIFFEVIGNKYNYTFSSFENNEKKLEKIIKTVEI